jgi:hypothetical protein
MKTAWTPENARAMRERIDKAKTPDDIANLEKSMNRLWNVGAFNQGEFTRLHVRIMEKAVDIEEYRARVQALEDEGMTTSDAQAIVDMEMQAERGGA